MTKPININIEPSTTQMNHIMVQVKDSQGGIKNLYVELEIYTVDESRINSGS